MKQNINLSLFFAEALATNKKAYKAIDKLFYKNIDKYLKIMKLNKNWEEHKITSEGSLEQDYYFKKILSILEDEESFNEVLEIAKNTYKIAYNYLNSKKRLVLSEFVMNLYKKQNLTDDEFNGNLTVIIILAINYDYEIDTEDEVYNRFLFGLSERLYRYEIPKRIEFEILDKEYKAFVNKVFLNLRGNYLKSIEVMPHLVPFDIVKSKYKRELNDLDKCIVPFEYVCDLEDISLISITDSVKISEKDIKNIITIFLNFNRAENAEDVNYKELYKFVVNCINFIALTREYKNSKKFFFKNINEELTANLEEKNNKLNSLESNNLALKEELEKLKKENELLNKQNNNLKNELNSLKKSKIELVELRNAIFNKENLELEEVQEVDLNKIKGIVFGGHPNWISKMQKEINWIFISIDAINFDTKLLNDVDYVFVNTNYVSHAMYYKIIENLNESNKLRYINSVNVDICLKEIKNNI